MNRPHKSTATRRQFLTQSGLAAAACWYPSIFSASNSSRLWAAGGESERADVLIVGGGLGGCAAALAATRQGLRVIMTEPTDWIGGQLTQQLVPPDEHRWIESFGAPASYRRLRDRIRNYYRTKRPLKPAAKSRPNLDPGDGVVSRLCHEPRVALAVLDELLAPAVKQGLLKIRLNTQPIGADVDGDQVRAIQFKSRDHAQPIHIEADYFIDASEEGDVLPLTGTEYVTGSESQKETGEPSAGDEARPDNMQSITWCYAIDYLPDEDHTIDKPAMYDFWQKHVPALTPPWPGRLLALHYSNPWTNEPKVLGFAPRAAGRKTPKVQGLNLWLYRRIINEDNFEKGTYASDISVVNWPQNDYMLGNIIDVSPEERNKHLEGARQLSLSLLYWLQTEAPRPDGQTGWKGLRLRPDVVGTKDGLAKYPYIRESRRIKAEFTVLEQHLDIQGEERRKLGEHWVAPSFPDSVGVGHYSMDLHPSTGGDNYHHTSSLPYQIPLGTLIPQRMRNLIAACKNIGTTHFTNGAYRLHPTEWGIGEAAGALVAYCRANNLTAHMVRNQDKHLKDFQDQLVKSGVELDWTKLA
ncbi:FAD-dependent oxidoreductase [Thalassoroseus pseudoceratinae]|uniref:FAD-dependent oxidoreductase n=1 Tax=Thalassoroseus pseudoceratinae TaxID=2713176 RepID=UPI00142121BF|nr:FAD-dependent oxidoreductase [Thalassoroseus pseudoceratinae]